MEKKMGKKIIVFNLSPREKGQVQFLPEEKKCGMKSMAQILPGLLYSLLPKFATCSYFMLCKSFDSAQEKLVQYENIVCVNCFY